IPEAFGKTGILGEKKADAGRTQQKEKLMLACGVISQPGETLRTRLEVEKRIGGRLAGIAGISVRHGFLPALYLAVDEKHRSKGIGTELVKKVLEKKKGILFLTVANDNAAAKKIYVKCGFRKIMPWRKIRGKPHELMIHF
ncbi:MAG: GNAT family N-acetyltransferase, partial [Candidatus Diapherotrites archaeon]|nr:GNAT family N-acetyltransferase [Candidatus Diapherotrites archaeon]